MLHTIGGLSSTGTSDKLKVNDPVKLPSFTVMDIVRNSGSENSDTLVSYLKTSIGINHKHTRSQPAIMNVYSCMAEAVCMLHYISTPMAKNAFSYLL